MLSAKNESLLSQALDALSAADKQHQKLAANHAVASKALTDVLNSSNAAGNSDASGDGTSNSQGASNADNPLMPMDGAGPRSARAVTLQRQREAEKRAIRR
jgi:hypothetical protein